MLLLEFTKVVIHNSGIDVANTAIGFNFENTIHLFKNADHFDLMELPEKNVTSQNSGCWGGRNLNQWRVGMLFTSLKSYTIYL